MIEIAGGIALGAIAVHVLRTVAYILWARYAFFPRGFIGLHPPVLLGRWPEGTRVPLPVAILTRFFESLR